MQNRILIYGPKKQRRWIEEDLVHQTLVDWLAVGGDYYLTPKGNYVLTMIDKGKALAYAQERNLERRPDRKHERIHWLTSDKEKTGD